MVDHNFTELRGTIHRGRVSRPTKIPVEGQFQDSENPLKAWGPNLVCPPSIRLGPGCQGSRLLRPIHLLRDGCFGGVPASATKVSNPARGLRLSGGDGELAMSVRHHCCLHFVRIRSATAKRNVFGAQYTAQLCLLLTLRPDGCPNRRITRGRGNWLGLISCDSFIRDSPSACAGAPCPLFVFSFFCLLSLPDLLAGLDCSRAETQIEVLL
jgi:hypothetical protein